MAYCITEVRHREFPTAGAVATALASIGTSLEVFLTAFRTYICPISPQVGQGFQMNLADDLEAYLERTLKADGLRPTRSRYELTYSRSLNQHADFGLVHDPSQKRVLFEVEFRPNFEKDLVKFQIGANEGILAAAVMVVAINRRSVNAAYTTMPEYEAVAKIIAALNPSYPLLLIGLRGDHAA